MQRDPLRSSLLCALGAALLLSLAAQPARASVAFGLSQPVFGPGSNTSVVAGTPTATLDADKQGFTVDWPSGYTVTQAYNGTGFPPTGGFEGTATWSATYSFLTPTDVPGGALALAVNFATDITPTFASGAGSVTLQLAAILDGTPYSTTQAVVNVTSTTNNQANPVSGSLAAPALVTLSAGPHTLVLQSTLTVFGSQGDSVNVSSNYGTRLDAQAPAVPEPATLASLALAGLLGLAGYGRRRRNA